MRRTNQTGLDLIKQVEGWRDTAYRCPAGVWTIGYGHTKDVYEGQRITREKGESLLRDDLNQAERAVEKLINVPLGDNQFAALVCFTYNVGSGSLEKSTLRRLLNGGDYGSVPDQLMRWNKVGGKEYAGLTRRRRAEGDLWRTPE